MSSFTDIYLVKSRLWAQRTQNPDISTKISASIFLRSLDYNSNMWESKTKVNLKSVLVESSYVPPSENVNNNQSLILKLHSFLRALNKLTEKNKGWT